MMMKLLSVIPLVASLAQASDVVSYDGYQVYRIKPTRDLDISSVQDKLKAAIDYDEWNLEDHDITIAVAPADVPAFEALDLNYKTIHADLGRSIVEESRPRSVWKRQADDLSWYDSYHDYEDHITYMEELQAAYPNHSEIVSTGTSYEGRDQFGIHIWGAEGPGKPAVVWHGTVHAREWISAPVVEFQTLQLLQGYGTDEDVTSFVDKYDFWIFPFVNPDGFVHTQTTDRMWRKNRMPPPASSNSTCHGIDVNRNWPYKWDANPNGASSDPCSQTYKGEAPGSTPEMKGMASLIESLRDGSGIQLFIDWHSFSQFILAPMGYDCNEYIPTLGEHIFVAHQTSQAIREVEGKTYVFGPSCAVLYASTGYSTDFAYAVGEAKYSYLIELRDTGDYGFILPPEQIRGTAEEHWAGMKTMLSLLDVDVFENH